MINNISGHILLCDDYDEKEISIKHIFDNLYVDNNMTANFATILHINIYPNETGISHSRYHIYSFIKETKGIGEDANFMYLGQLNLPAKGENDKQDISVYRHRQIFRFNNFIFPNTGKYAIDMYATTERLSYRTNEELYMKLFQNNCLLDTLTFNVQIKAH
ncbi:hypothetical protein SD457_11180 [Coprobacillaceae bacterium CR2/5/TPMF4]|nr:hypothetical protein SD457_11180 [Coprobacillaceae bacterium CR2/5/TPMF4]